MGYPEEQRVPGSSPGGGALPPHVAQIGRASVGESRYSICDTLPAVTNFPLRAEVVRLSRPGAPLPNCVNLPGGLSLGLPPTYIVYPLGLNGVRLSRPPRNLGKPVTSSHPGLGNEEDRNTPISAILLQGSYVR